MTQRILNVQRRVDELVALFRIGQINLVTRALDVGVVAYRSEVDVPSLVAVPLAPLGVQAWLSAVKLEALRNVVIRAQATVSLSFMASSPTICRPQGRRTSARG